MRDPCGGGNVQDLDCSNIDILAVILYCSFARYYSWENWVKTHEIPLHYFLQLYIVRIYDYDKIKSLIKKQISVHFSPVYNGIKFEII